MHRPFLLLVGATCVALADLCSCAPPVAPPRNPATVSPAPVVDDAALALFAERNVTGSFVLLDLASGAQTIVGRDDAARGHLPCSTFKIPNTLIGLETGVIPDEHFTLPWDGKKGWIDDWNRDHDLASAMRYSVVWYYQEVARRIGQERMTLWVHKLQYGNESTAGGIDRFWLDADVGDKGAAGGGLRISALQQVDFLRRLRTGALPVRPENAGLVMRILPAKWVGTSVVRGKTGLGRAGGKSIGWLVGYAERGDRVWVYATHVESSADDMERLMPLRRELTHALLARYGVANP